jgi:hypothetical protein
MTQRIGLMAASLLATGMALSQGAQADFEVTGPDGRRIFLKDNGTWRYVEGTGKDQPKGKSKDEGEAVLTLERKAERGGSCRFTLRLVNNLPYEIRSLVPYYAAYRSTGVIYDTVSPGSGFVSLKPGDKQDREIEFSGITCQDIVRVQVVGGDRCDMGDLGKWAATGACLARVRVVASDVVRFDK